MKLSDIKGEKAFEVVEEILDPIAEIALDKEFKDKPRIEKIKVALKNHREAVIKILAALELKTVDEYMETLNLLTLPQQLLDIFNDPELSMLFQSQE